MKPRDYIFGEYMKHGIVTDTITGKKERKVMIVYPKWSGLVTIIIYAFVLIGLPTASLFVRTIPDIQIEQVKQFYFYCG